MGVKVREEPKGSGSFWVFIDHKGKRKAKKIGKDKRVALEVAKKIEAKLVLGDVGVLNEEKTESGIPVFEDYAELWLNVTVPATCKPSTIDDYHGIMKNHVLPFFGKMPVEQINRMTVKKFLMGKIGDGFASSTVSHMKSCIAGTLSIAIDDEVISVNPAQRLGKIFIKKHEKDEINPYTKDEVSALLSAFVEHWSAHYPFVLTLCRTGMRFGEVLGLKWDDIDFEQMLIHVNRTFSRSKVVLPKNSKTRKVDMSKQLTNVLKELKHFRKIETVQKGWGKVPEWVFVNNVGNPLDINHWRKRVFYKVLEKGGLRKIRVHDLRHTYASLLIQAGESLAYVRDQLGHHSIKVTVDIYGHLTPGGNKAAVDGLDDMEEDATIRNHQ